jgi:hypothetical protein
MSWWNPTSWWYGTSAEPVPPSNSAGDAIELAMDSIDALHSKRMHLLKKSADLLKEAKEHKSKGDTSRAMSCMKRKQQVDTLARQLEGQLLNLEKASMMMDSTATTVELAQTMKSGSDTIKNLLQQVSVSEIEGVADDLDEQMIEAHDLGEALARPMGGDPEVEESILAEMEEWDHDKRVDNLPDVPEVVNNSNNDDDGNTKVLAPAKELVES